MDNALPFALRGVQRGTILRDPLPQLIRLEDYTPPPFLIDGV